MIVGNHARDVVRDATRLNETRQLNGLVAQNFCNKKVTFDISVKCEFTSVHTLKVFTLNLR